MSRETIKRPLFLLIAGVALVGAGLSLLLYLHDLHVRFPGIDLSRARMGIASWYSEQDKNINKHTANGEVFDDKAMTCASWYYPFDEELLVINMLSGKWVVCRVNDRGPNKRLNREIDLSKAAFSEIANLKKGLIYTAVIPTQKKEEP